MTSFKLALVKKESIEFDDLDIGAEDFRDLLFSGHDVPSITKHPGVAKSGVGS